jgi:GTP cyclohydrolase I
MENLMDKHLVDSVYISDEEKRALAVQLLLSSVGEDIYREGLLDTPSRVARMYEEIFGGYKQDPEKLLTVTFDSDDDEGDKYGSLVLVKDIPLYSHCEHHMVPFFGKAHVAYIPEEKVVGISKIARLIDCFSHRLQIQERLTTQVANALEKFLNPKGVAVVIEAEHMCMTMRGVRKPGARTVTSTLKGVFLKEVDARAEFYSLIGLK